MQLPNSAKHIHNKIYSIIAVLFMFSCLCSEQAIAAESASKTIAASANTIIVKPEINTAPVKLIIEASISNIAPAPKPTKDDLIETWTKGTNNNVEFVIAITKIIVSIIILIATLFLILYLIILGYIEITQDTIIMELFEVPEELAKEGYSGKSIAYQLSDKFEEIQQEAKINIYDAKSSSSKTGNIELPGRIVTPEVSVGNFSIKSLKFLFSPFKKLTGHSTFYISGEVQSLDKQYKIIARCENDHKKTPYTSQNLIKKENIQTELLSVATALCEQIYPIPTGFYLIRQGENTKGKGEEIINTFLKNSKTSKKDRAAIHVYFGDYLAYNKRNNEAIENYKKAIELNPKEYLAYNNWGIIASSEKESIEKFIKAIEVNPKHDIAYYNLGIVYVNQEKYEDAIKQYIKAISLNPTDAYIYANLGIAYAYNNDYDKAIENYKKAIEINPKDVVAYYNLGESLVHEGQYKHAQEAFNNVKLYGQQYLVEKADKKIQEIEEILKNQK